MTHHTIHHTTRDGFTVTLADLGTHVAWELTQPMFKAPLATPHGFEDPILSIDGGQAPCPLSALCQAELALAQLTEGTCHIDIFSGRYTADFFDFPELEVATFHDAPFLA